MPIGQVVADPQRRMVACRSKPDDDGTGSLLELGLRLAGGHAPVHDFLRASPPLFDQSAAIEDPGDQRVAKAGAVVRFRSATVIPGGKQPGAGDFQPIIVDGDEDRLPRRSCNRGGRAH